MPQHATSAKVGPGKQVELRRVLDATPEEVWAAWTTPEGFSAWFGTPPYVTPAEKVRMDLREGGTWRASQVSLEDGSELPFVGTYREISPPSRLVLTFENPLDRSDPNIELATVTLEDLGGRTELIFAQQGHLPEGQYELLAAGYSAFFERLAGHLTAMREVR
jgi:uncharacterized protein YndB with AHSA1/START domain